MAYYVRDNNNNLIEGLSKEEIYALLDEAIRTGQLPSVDDETAFVTKLKCSVTGVASSVAFITEAKYNELRTGGLLKANTLYFITDDNTEDTLENAIAQAKQEAILESKTYADTRFTDVDTKFTQVNAKINGLFRTRNMTLTSLIADKNLIDKLVKVEKIEFGVGGYIRYRYNCNWSWSSGNSGTLNDYVLYYINESGKITKVNNSDSILVTYLDIPTVYENMP